MAEGLAEVALENSSVWLRCRLSMTATTATMREGHVNLQQYKMSFKIDTKDIDAL
jgi:hypothetical protein